MTAPDLMAAWDRQQELYIPAREARYRLMTDLVAESAAGTGRPLRVLDLACGPGSASRRVAEAFGDVRIVAVDLDPVLLALGAETWPAHLPAPRWVRADLTGAVWVDELRADGPFDAVVSTTALHWLALDELRQVYAAARALLRPGGILLNGDYAPSGATTPLADLADRVARRREQRAADAGVPDWDRWWRDVASSGLFEAELRERAAAFDSRVRPPSPSRSEHLDALSSAGLQSPTVVWQDLDEVLIAATA